MSDRLHEVTAEVDSELNAALVLKCVDCRFSQGQGYGLQCRCPKQQDWADRVGSDHWTAASLIRDWDCHGRWWEARLPEAPHGWQRFVCWLRRVSR